MAIEIPPLKYEVKVDPIYKLTVSEASHVCTIINRNSSRNSTIDSLYKSHALIARLFETEYKHKYDDDNQLEEVTKMIGVETITQDEERTKTLLTMANYPFRQYTYKELGHLCIEEWSRNKGLSKLLRKALLDTIVPKTWAQNLFCIVKVSNLRLIQSLEKNGFIKRGEQFIYGQKDNETYQLLTRQYRRLDTPDWELLTE